MSSKNSILDKFWYLEYSSTVCFTVAYFIFKLSNTFKMPYECTTQTTLADDLKKNNARVWFKSMNMITESRK